MTNKQTTSTIMMIRPASFGFNEETAVNNSFQINDTSNSSVEISDEAIAEFDGFVALLRSHEIEVIVIEDTKYPEKPDAVFPNNWISFHEDGSIITYPMFSKNRRIERRDDIIKSFSETFIVESSYTLAHYEEKDMFLEGTGSMILDRVNKVVYACISPRTDIRVLDKFCILKGYKKIVFYAKDQDGEDIYHTNVMMALGTKVAIVCLDSLSHPDEKKEVIEQLTKDGKEVLDISIDQVNHFAGNMLEVRNATGQPFMVMSRVAHNSLTPDQIKLINKSCSILSYPIGTIEKYGGGSVRCMMAEVFLPRK